MWPKPGGRPVRMRAIRRRMSIETFERSVPVLPGWKREYYDGKARVRPSWATVVLELTAAPPAAPRVTGLRRLTEADRPELADAFLDAFRFAPDYCDYPLAAYRKTADQYLTDFFGAVRGQRSPASVLVVRAGRVVAAALVKERPDKPPLLDCLLVRPDVTRRGLGTAVVATAWSRLSPAGPVRLVSTVKLANTASLAWHARFGFTELPCLWITQARCFSLKYEIERRAKYDPLPADEVARLEAEASRLFAEMNRLHDLPAGGRSPILDL